MTDKKFDKIYQVLDWWKFLIDRSTDIKPTFGQAWRSWQFAYGGIKTAMLNDTTSAGKTFSANLIYDAIEIREGKDRRALLFAPENAIREAWAQKYLDQYHPGLGFRRKKICYLKDLKNFSEADNFDVVALNYFEMGLKKKEKLYENRFFRYIMDNCHKFQIVFEDEPRHFKNPKTNRDAAYIELRERTKSYYYILLDATPYASGLEDLGMAFYTLDPSRFPPAKYDYNENPNVIKHLKANGQWFVITREEIKELFGLKDLKTGDVKLVDMPEKNVERYLKIWKEIIESGALGSRIHNLSKELIFSKIPSLKPLVQDSIANNEQVSIFVNYRTGITDNLFDIFNKIYPGRVVMIDGRTNFKKRLEIAEKIRERYYDVSILSTGTMNEAISLQPGNKVAHVFALEPFRAPWNQEQGVGRFYRYGQLENVLLTTLLARSEELEKQMIQIMRANKKRGIRYRVGWSAETIDVTKYENCKNLLGVIKDKVERAGESLDDIEKLLINVEKHPNNPVLLKLPRQEKDLRNYFMRGIAQQANPFYGGGSENYLEAVSNIKEEDIKEIDPETAKKISKIIDVKRIGIYKGILVDKELIKRKKAHDENKAAVVKKLVEAYDPEFWEHHKKDWQGLAPFTSNNLVAQTIFDLERFNEEDLETIVDYGSGPGCLIQHLKKPLICVDIDIEMLEKGYKHFKNFKPERSNGQPDETIFLLADYQDPPLKSNSVDVINASHTLQFCAQENKKRQLEDTILNITRILKPYGYFFSILPNTATLDYEFESYLNLLRDYDCKIIIGDKVKGKNNDSKTVFQTYFVLARVGNKKPKKYISISTPPFWPVARFIYSGTGNASAIRLKDSPRKKPKQSKFSEGFFFSNKLSLEETIRKAIKEGKLRK